MLPFVFVCLFVCFLTYTLIYVCISLKGPPRTPCQCLPWARRPGCKRGFSLSSFVLFELFFTACGLMVFPFLFKKKQSYLVSNPGMRSLIAGKVTSLLGASVLCKGRDDNEIYLQGCCGGLTKATHAQGSPPCLVPSQCMVLLFINILLCT